MATRDINNVSVLAVIAAGARAQEHELVKRSRTMASVRVFDVSGDSDSPTLIRIRFPDK